MAVLDWLQQLLGGGDPEAAGAAQASTAMQPATQPFVNLGRDLINTLAVQPVTDAFGVFDRVLSGQGFTPEEALGVATLPIGGSALSGSALSGGGLGAGIRAFHGSPHSFDRFDLSKIGTGEGNQTFGRGLYFSEAEPVAARYREMTAGLPKSSLIGPGGETLATGGPVQFQSAMRLPDVAPPGMDYLGASIKRLWAEGRPVDAPSVIKEAWGGLQLPPDALPEITAKVEAAIERAKPLLAQYRIETTTPGHMYEVDLKAHPEQFLNLDQSLGNQSTQVQRLLERLAIPESMMSSNAGEALARAEKSPIRAADLFNRGGDPVQMNAADVAAKFYDLGIPGTRYLDQFSRGSPSEGTHNYAVWDDRIIEIMRKFGLLPPLAAGGLLAAQPGEAAPP